MASRKEQKEQARAARLAAERALAERAQRNRRMLTLGGVLAAVVVVVAVLIVVSSSGSNNPGGIVTGAKQKQYEAQVNTLLAGIPQSGTTLGKPSAAVSVTYYGDLECPVCKDFTLGQAGGGFPQLVAQDVRQGRVKVTYRSFCTATCNSHSQSVFNDQQVAAYAAGSQNLFWDYAELFYREQGDETTDYVDEKYLDTLAAQVNGLDIAKWQTDRGDPALLAQVQADEASATADHVSATPSLIVKGPKGSVPLPAGAASYSELEQAIKLAT
ncbi:MAG: DsbA family protein [Solirubrobacteraceae bacterium]|jgi:protein-disulfide isomerase